MQIYAGIMLYAFVSLLCKKICRHNKVSLIPIHQSSKYIMLVLKMFTSSAVSLNVLGFWDRVRVWKHIWFNFTFIDIHTVTKWKQNDTWSLQSTHNSDWNKDACLLTAVSISAFAVERTIVCHSVISFHSAALLRTSWNKSKFFKFWLS